MVDFGLARKHIRKDGVIMPMRTYAEFRGTVPYASLNAHNNKDLGRRDDLWSFFFVVIEFLT